MAIYKDKNTGAVVVTGSDLVGDWEIVKETVNKEKEEAK